MRSPANWPTRRCDNDAEFWQLESQRSELFTGMKNGRPPVAVVVGHRSFSAIEPDDHQIVWWPLSTVYFDIHWLLPT